MEARTVVAKYSGVDHGEEHLSNGGPEFVFDVKDEGCGFNQASTGFGTVIQGMADRLAAIDGDLEVRGARRSASSSPSSCSRIR